MLHDGRAPCGSAKAVQRFHTVVLASRISSPLPDTTRRGGESALWCVEAANTRLDPVMAGGPAPNILLGTTFEAEPEKIPRSSPCPLDELDIALCAMPFRRELSNLIENAGRDGSCAWPSPDCPSQARRRFLTSLVNQLSSTPWVVRPSWTWLPRRPREGRLSAAQRA